MTKTALLLDSLRAYLKPRAGEVPARFLDGLDGPLPERDLVPRGLSCLRLLDDCAERTGLPEQPLARALAGGGDELAWGQTYGAGDFGEAFLENYGWMELIGTRGHFASAAIAAGFLLLGPATHYPDHHHAAEEIYIPLTGGTLWSMGGAAPAARHAGEVIHHPSDVSHSMRTGEAPLLALYLWRGGDLAQRSVIGKGR
ncbi:MAG: transcriptional regulator [Rhizobiaceae bacterium]|nr:transcriptional regulator [Rhizobiaceae bacterium]